MRLRKSDAEINLMRQACTLSGEAFNSVMKLSKGCKLENNIEALIDFQCRLRGAQRLAYPPVVAAGLNANIIHYINNDDVIGENELILMDAGGEFNGYNADITRSWPISGKFTQGQLELYEATLYIQQQCLTVKII